MWTTRAYCSHYRLVSHFTLEISVTTGDGSGKKITTTSADSFGAHDVIAVPRFEASL
jgi:hypothetical protein